MKTLSLTAALMGATLLAAQVATPAMAQASTRQAPARPAPAQPGAAATLPDSFEAEAPADRQKAGPPVSTAAPDIARSEEALRVVIAAFQSGNIDYTDFTTGLAEQVRAKSGEMIPLIQQFGAIKSVEHRGQQNGADIFRVVFDKQATDWVIGFDAEDQIAALLFRPAQD